MKWLQLLGMIAALSLLPLSAQQIQISKENKTIAITTSGDASVLADTAVVNVGFQIFGKDQTATYSEATKISNGVVAALLASGVSKDAIQSNDQRLTPITPAGDDDKVRYSQGLRFEFVQSWHITVKAEEAAHALHTAFAAGANSGGGVDWQLQSDDALQAEAAKKALEHAREIAQRMALGLGSKLGALVYASNETPPRGIFAYLGKQRATLNTESASVSSQIINLKPLALSPNLITRSATVYAVFSIE